MDTDKSLHNCSVLVTRPQHQAASFCQMLGQAGASVVHFPVIEIKTCSMKGKLLDTLKQLDQQDMLIFTSTNAAQFALTWLNAFRGSAKDKPNCLIAAIGKKTAELLKANTIHVDIQPQVNFNSESLLATPDMKQLAGKRITLIKGTGGRQLLATTLEARGANLQIANIYRRKCPIPNDASLALLRSKKIDIITLTSGESCENLFSLLQNQNIPWLPYVTLLAGSQRIQKVIASIKLNLPANTLENPVWVANNPSDEQMLAALYDWNGTHHIERLSSRQT